MESGALVTKEAATLDANYALCALLPNIERHCVNFQHLNRVETRWVAFVSIVAR